MKLRIFYILLIISLTNTKLLALDVEVDILNNNYTPLPLVMVDFYTDNESQALYDKIKDRVFYNIDRSGVFDIRESKIALINGDVNLLDTAINISKYTYYNYLITGKMLLKGNYYYIELIIVDIFNNKTLTTIGYKFDAQEISKNTTFVAGELSNYIYRSILGLEGYFNTKLAFVENKNSLTIANYDGSNKQSLIKSDGQIYGPVFSNNNRYIAYVDFKEGRSQIYIYDLIFNKSILLANLTGLSLAPRFSPDDKNILFSVAHSGVANIYEVDISSQRIKKLTNSYAINLAGGYSFDNNYIVFNSDKTGTPHIYTMDTSGQNVVKVSNTGGAYYTPSFAPNANIILATKIIKSDFFITILSLEGQEKIITKDKYVESPSWLRDGRHVIYQYRYAGDNKNPLYSFFILDIISGFKLPILQNGNVMDPNYSHNVKMRSSLGSAYALQSAQMPFTAENSQNY